MCDGAIIGGPKEPEVRRLAHCLEELGHSPLIIDASTFPQHHSLTFGDGSWRYGDHELNSVKAFFLRSLHCNKLTTSSAGELNRHLHALREKDSILGSLLRWAGAQGKLILNPVDTLLCHFYKLDSLERLRNANIPIPSTLGTNDPNAVSEFAQSHKRLICKPLAGGAEAIAISVDDLSPLFLAQLQNAPVMLQERIYGDDIRVYVLGDQVIAAASLSTDHVDFRTGHQDFQTTTLTEAESADIIHAAKLMSLNFAGIDFKRTKEGRHFILDINPAPMFAGFENITGLEIASHIARYLVEKSMPDAFSTETDGGSRHP
jgi:glutathione synthase/RimK-type ligase-like ATP-grasp enzyme